MHDYVQSDPNLTPCLLMQHRFNAELQTRVKSGSDCMSINIFNLENCILTHICIKTCIITQYIGIKILGALVFRPGSCTQNSFNLIKFFEDDVGTLNA